MSTLPTITIELLGCHDEGTVWKATFDRYEGYGEHPAVALDALISSMIEAGLEVSYGMLAGKEK